MLRIKILVRKNLKMSEGKVASQAVHAALGLAKLAPQASDPMLSVVTLLISDAKFEEKKAELSQPLGPQFDLTAPFYIVKDAGYTEIAPGTETCMAFLENDPRIV